METVFGVVDPTVYGICVCGREVKKLNAVGDKPKCVGCGFPPSICRCAVLGQLDG